MLPSLSSDVINELSEWLSLSEYRSFRAACRLVRDSLNKVHLCLRLEPLLFPELRAAGGDDFATSLVFFRLSGDRYHLTQQADREHIAQGLWNFHSWTMEAIDRQDLPMFLWCVNSIGTTIGVGRQISTRPSRIHMKQSANPFSDMIYDCCTRCAAEGFSLGLRVALDLLLQTWMFADGHLGMYDRLTFCSHDRLEKMAMCVRKASMNGSSVVLDMALAFIAEQFFERPLNSLKLSHFLEKLPGRPNRDNSMLGGVHRCLLAALGKVRVYYHVGDHPGHFADLVGRIILSDAPALADAIVTNIPLADGTVAPEVVFYIGHLAARMSFPGVAHYVTTTIRKLPYALLKARTLPDQFCPLREALSRSTDGKAESLNVLRIYLSEPLFSVSSCMPPFDRRSTVRHAIQICLKVGKTPMTAALARIITACPEEARTVLATGFTEEHTCLYDGALLQSCSAEFLHTIEVLLQHGWRPWREFIVKCVFETTEDGFRRILEVFQRQNVSVELEKGETDGPVLLDALQGLSMCQGSSLLHTRGRRAALLARAGATVTEEVSALAAQLDIHLSSYVGEHPRVLCKTHVLN